MGKGLITLCLTAAIAFSSYGAENGNKPKDLNEILISNSNSTTNKTSNGVVIQSRRDYLIKGGELQVIANKYSPYQTNLTYKEQSDSRNLEYKVNSINTNTIINLTDFGANGLSIGDTLDLTHNLPSGYQLKLKAEYPKEYELKIEAKVYLDGKLVSKATKDTSKTLISIIPFGNRLIVGPGIESKFREGNNLYFQAVAEMISGQEPKSFPMEEINSSFSSLDSKIKKSKESKIADLSLKVLSDSLSNGFKDLAKNDHKEKQDSLLVKNDSTKSPNKN